MTECARCGSINPPPARFCMSCGVPLASTAADAPVRKTVTVVFGDLVGFTSLGEGLDAETLRRIMSEYFGRMRTVLERHGGTVEKFIGDAVMAVFGVPTLHEDDALRAVQAAVAMRESLRGLDAALEAPGAGQLQVRIGVNTGEVVAGDSEGDPSLVTGAAVTLAARLEENAAPGEILVGPSTYALVSDSVEVERVELDLKGLGTARAYRLLSASAAARPPHRRFHSPMVGREHELDLLLQTYKRVLEAQSCVLVTVTGAPGIGKTRLTEEFLGVLGDEVRVLSGRCLPYGDGITFWPLAEVVRGAAGITEEDSAEAARAKLEELLQDAPDAELVCERIAGAIGIGPGVHGTDEVFWGARKLLEALAVDRALVVVFDDIHWGEPTFHDLVDYVGGSSRAAPLLLVCLARPELFEVRSSWGRGARRRVLVELEPLTEAASDRLVDGLLGGAPAPDRARRRVRAAAQGNPLFVEEMLGMWMDEGLLEDRDGRWRVRSDLAQAPAPPTIQALLSARLDALPPAIRAVAQRASIVGQGFWWGAVNELSPPEARADIGAHLQTLVARQFVEPTSSSFAEEDAFAFRHLLVREVAYAAVPKETRAELHERFASWLERKAAERMPEYEEIVAYHLEQAHRYGTELGRGTAAARTAGERAATRLLSAGRRALARGDMPGAAKLLQRAVALLDPDDERRLAALLDVATALIESGAFAQAESVLHDTLAEARRRGAPAVESNANVELMRLRFFSHPRSAFDDARHAAAAAVAESERLGSDLGLARACHLLAIVDFHSGRAAAAETAWERALGHARAARDVRQEHEVMAWLATAMEFGPTPAQRAIERCREIAAAASGDGRVAASALSSEAVLEAMLGRFDRARERAARARKVLADLGLKVALGSAAQSFGAIEVLAGDMRAAESELRAGYARLADLDEKGFLATVVAQLAHVLCAQARYAEAAELTRVSADLSAAEDVTGQALWRAAWAKVLAHEGRHDEAERVARDAVARIEATDFLNDHAAALADLATVLRDAKGTDEARPALARAVELYERKGNTAAASRVARALDGGDGAEAAPTPGAPRGQARPSS
jgi:predicted ATPase/class 3 adenylate cyclase